VNKFDYNVCSWSFIALFVSPTSLGHSLIAISGLKEFFNGIYIYIIKKIKFQIMWQDLHRLAIYTLIRSIKFNSNHGMTHLYFS
jgi:hypothetical protein